MSRGVRHGRLSGRSREIRAVAALALVCALVLLAVSAGCGPGPRAGAGERNGTCRATRATVGDASPADAQDARQSTTAVGLDRSMKLAVPGGSSLYAASKRWLALLDTGRELGGERIVLASSDGRLRRVVLDGAIGRRARLAVTDVRVSDSWLVWEEASQYDMELGGAARWRIYAAPILVPGPALGPSRLLDSGLVADHPRCELALSGRRLAIASTRLPRADGGSDTAVSDGGRTEGVSTGRPIGARAASAAADLTIIDLPAGTRRSIFSAAGSVDGLSWGDDRIVLTLTGRDRRRRSRAIVFDGSGARVGSVSLAPGIEFAGPASGHGDLVAASVSTSGSEFGDLFVFAVSGLSLWRGPATQAGPQWLGDRLVYLAPDPQTTTGTRSIGVLDPVSGMVRPVFTPAGSDPGRHATGLLPVLVPGSAGPDGKLVIGLEPAEPAVGGDGVAMIESGRLSE